MNKQQIKAELRRSAIEDDDPACEVNTGAYCAAREYTDLSDPPIVSMSYEECRLFFLIVEEAL